MAPAAHPYPPASHPAGRRGHGRRLGLGLAGAVLLGACTPAPAPPAPTPPAPTTAAADGTADCPAPGVRIRSYGADAAMGLRALSLELVNCGTAAHPLNGYPAPRVLDGDGEPIPVQVVDGAEDITSGFDDPPRPLTLQPGERATAAVLWRNLVTDSTVAATTGERLEVAPAPGQPAQAVDPYGPIDLGNTGRIGVSAWEKATEPAPTPDPDTPVPSAPTPTRSVPPL